MSDTRRPTREAMISTIENYYAGCNESDADKIVASLTPEAVHYFPEGAPQGPFHGALAIASGWRTAVAALGSQWTIDHLVVDESASEVLIEWTHWKSKLGVYLRGAEICRFSFDGRISEIRAYYAAPAQNPPSNHELGEFDYEGRGYPVTSPVRVEDPDD